MKTEFNNDIAAEKKKNKRANTKCLYASLVY